MYAIGSRTSVGPSQIKQKKKWDGNGRGHEYLWATFIGPKRDRKMIFCLPHEKPHTGSRYGDIFVCTQRCFGLETQFATPRPIARVGADRSSMQTLRKRMLHISGLPHAKFGVLEDVWRQYSRAACLRVSCSGELSDPRI